MSKNRRKDMPCPHCGEESKALDFCPSCRERIKPAPADTEPELTVAGDALPPLTLPVDDKGHRRMTRRQWMEIQGIDMGEEK